jgi:AraC family transcriptional regulator of adaptative response / DNA-3-methyladenine glycosylase II
MQCVNGLTQAALHHARISRDARFDGKFFIAVRSTGIYCRPICPSPTSKESSVRYYATAAAAAGAGYRPCRRCRPEAAPGSAAWLGPSAVVRRALRLIEGGALDECPVEKLATRLGVGARHLGRLFTQYVGVSPIAVAQTRRLHFAKQLIDETSLSITRVAMTSGFGSVRRFNDAYRHMYQCAPRDARRIPGVNKVRRHDDEVALTLAYRPPYDWQNMLAFLADRAIAGIESVDARSYKRTIRLNDRYAVIEVTLSPRPHALSLRVCGAAPSDLLEISTNVRRMFDLAADPVAIGEVLSADSLLLPLLKQNPGLRIPGSWEGFECAILAIIQRESNASEVMNQLVQQFGERIERAAGGLTHLFPSATALARADLTEIGLSFDCIEAMQTLARTLCENHVGKDLAQKTLIEALEGLPRVGRWSAPYVALRAFGEPDAFPMDKIGSPANLEKRAEAWRPWRGYAALHLWQSYRDVNSPGRCVVRARG